MISFSFEISGKVQGVYFRKYTHEKAIELGLRGWVMNTDNDTVVGVAEGVEDRVKEMQTWLRVKGSPRSRIDEAIFTNEKRIDTHSHTTFQIKK